MVRHDSSANAGTVEFWFEFASTYSHPAAQRIEALARERGIPILWRPFLLGPIFAEQGWGDSPFNLYPAKGRYMWRDLERICTAKGIAWQKPTRFPRNGLIAARVALAADGEPWQADLVRALYLANFAEDREIGERSVVAEVLASLDQDADEWLSRSQTPGAKLRLRDQTDRARSLGIFGAPSFTVAGELYWGHDRMEDALDHAVRVRAA